MIERRSLNIKLATYNFKIYYYTGNKNLANALLMRLDYRAEVEVREIYLLILRNKLKNIRDIS